MDTPMDTLERYRNVITTYMSEYASIPYSHGNTQRHLVFDRERDRYLLTIVGWEDIRQEHGCIIHL